MSKNKRSNREKEIIEKLLGSAGITINGTNPWDIKVNDERVYPALLHEGSLGLGESYMAGWWDCEQVDQLITRLIRADLESHVKKCMKFEIRMLLSRFINFQNRRRALEVGKVHYDIDPDLYKVMLDSEMNYSCAYWKDARTLDEAQRAKLELSCRKLKLEPGMRVLDIGCGFGAFAKYAAKYHKVHVVGITISEQQALWARKNCRKYPVEIRFQDYRDVSEHFDRIVSIGMFEHVGKTNYKGFMATVFRNLVDDGLFLLHTIGTTSAKGVDPWVNKYIFPNSALPTAKEIPNSCIGNFVIEDWHNLGGDYVKTLRAWYKNFIRHWNSLKKNHDERFFRMWTYYLSVFMGGFQARHLQIWQVILSKKYLKKEYVPVR
ncbi:MAG: cyclopropane fatty acyl phospholipid synthase [Desulfobulbaceae bacterium BRH_c16a]|nr:MAG: cyclopropane fatty acyl phospholipid synthase [Desulfobulbaceae bacterium BRH_c16a]